MDLVTVTVIAQSKNDRSDLKYLYLWSLWVDSQSMDCTFVVVALIKMLHRLECLPALICSFFLVLGAQWNGLLRE